jgi:serine/threonine-protein kinase
VDGVARVIDFGVAKASGRLQSTAGGVLKGKSAYMAPEQLGGGDIDRRVDVYAASVVLWEALAGRPLVVGENHAQVLVKVLKGGFLRPSEVAPAVDPRFDPIVMKGLALEPRDRFATAEEMALALEKGIGVASPAEVASWVKAVGAKSLSGRAARVRELESGAAFGLAETVERPIVASGNEHVRSDAATEYATPRPLETVTTDATIALAVARPSNAQVPMSAAPPAHSPAKSPRSSGAGVIAIVAVVGVAVAIGVVAIRRGPSTRHVNAPPPVTVPAAAPPTSSATAGSADHAPPSPSGRPAPKTSASAVKIVVPPRRPPRAGSSKAVDCEQPIYVDDDGIRRVKPECQ